MQATANVTKETTNWNRVNWRDSNRVVRNLRQRIFRATREQNWQKVRGLQKLLMKCYSNILLAVRRVTRALLWQIHSGSRQTSGTHPRCKRCISGCLGKIYPLEATTIKAGRNTIAKR